MTYYEHILSLLPHNMQAEGNAENIKKILKIFAKHLDKDKKSDDLYSFLLSSEVVSGSSLDLLADMFYVYRQNGETDERFRKRLTYTIVSRKNGNTLPAIIGTINSLVENGSMKLYENYGGLPANIYLVGHTTTEEFNYVYDVVIDLLPVGVRLVVPVIRFGKWQDVLDLVSVWGNLKDRKYIW